MLQWLNDNKDWLFSGIGVVALAALYNSRTRVIAYLSRYLFRRMEREIEEKIKERLNEIISEDSLVRARIKVDQNDNIKFYCVTFQINENKRKPYDRRWIKKSFFEIRHDTNGFKLEKQEIDHHMKDPSDPYKFYMTIPNSTAMKEKYYLCLAEAGMGITGSGEPDEDEGKWRIWFLINDQPIHPDPQSLPSLNHTLVNRAHIVNQIYSANSFLSP